MLRRGRFWGALALGPAYWALPARGAAASGNQVLVVVNREVAAYSAAVDAALERLRERGLQALEVDESDRPGITRAADNCRVIAAFGAGAFRAGLDACELPVVAAMGLRARLLQEAAGREGRLVGALSLDVPFQAAIESLHAAFPSIRDIGVLEPSASLSSAKSLVAQAKASGLRVKVASCTGPEDLIAAFGRLKIESEIVWCQPAETLYTTTTVKPLILESLRSRVGLVGFSGGLVRAGAVAALVPDFETLGIDASNIAADFLADGAPRSVRPPREFRLLLNRRVLRILGLRTPNADQVEFEMVD